MPGSISMQASPIRDGEPRKSLSAGRTLALGPPPVDALGDRDPPPYVLARTEERADRIERVSGAEYRSCEGSGGWLLSVALAMLALAVLKTRTLRGATR